MSDFLFARPSFLAGTARTLDLGAQFDSYNTSLSAEQADQLALFADWLAVCQDFWSAIHEYECEVPASVRSDNLYQHAACE